MGLLHRRVIGANCFIAEQMGRTLQRTSLSLNIKERLDYSCAIFGPDGELVANAPHVPVHLGSMSYAVKYQQELHGTSLRPGDVLVSNHPGLFLRSLIKFLRLTSLPQRLAVPIYQTSQSSHRYLIALERTSASSRHLVAIMLISVGLVEHQ